MATCATSPYSRLMEVLEDRGYPVQEPVKARKITYPENLAKELKNSFKKQVLRDNPEILYEDQKSTSVKGTFKNNLIFFTPRHASWISTLRNIFPHHTANDIQDAKQIKVYDNQRLEKAILTINVYHTGTILVQGIDTDLREFEKNYLNLKMIVE